MGVLNFTALRQGLRQGMRGQAGLGEAGTKKAGPESCHEKNKQPGVSSSRALNGKGGTRASAAGSSSPQGPRQKEDFALDDKLNESGFCIGCEMLSVDGLGSKAERRWCMRAAGKESAYKFEFRHIADDVKVYQCPRVKDGCPHRVLD